MFRISKIAIEGFKSFGSDQIFVFPKEVAGFYLIGGVNKVEPDLGPNGSGKSSFLDSLVFCLFGKTARGLRAKDVANRSGQFETSVCMEFEIDGRLYGLTRTWNPNSLVLDEPGQSPKLVEQYQVDALIGTNYDLFLKTVLFGQFQVFFFDENPADKLRVMSSILELTTWDNATARSRSLGKELHDISSREQLEVAKLDGEFAALDGQRAKVNEMRISFETERSEQMVYRKAEIETIKSNVSSLSETEAKHKITIDAINTKLSKKGTLLEILLRSKKKNSEIQIEIQKAIGILEERLFQANNKDEKISSISGPCPFCDQAVPASHKKRISKLVEEERNGIREELKMLRIQEEGNAVKSKEIEKGEKDIQKEFTAFKKSLEDLEERTNNIKTKIAVQNESLSRLQLALKDIKSQANPYTDNLARLTKKHGETSVLLETKRAKIRTLNSDVANCEFWAEKFKEIRLWVVEQALTELEMHVNNALVELGLIGYTVRFDIEKPRADGSGVIKSFHVLISNKANSLESIPWESWSGGETQRLRLAGTIGIADLISSRHGFFPTLEFWDEPTAHLSQEGIEDLLVFLGTRAKTRNKQVWLVDHRSLNAGDFDGVITIVKDEDGSHFQQPQPRTAVRRQLSTSNSS